MLMHLAERALKELCLLLSAVAVVWVLDKSSAFPFLVRAVDQRKL